MTRQPATLKPSSGERVHPGPCEILLTLGLLLSFATQLRVATLPVGVGEICLGFGIGGLALDALHDRTAQVTPAFWTMLTFWAVFLAAQLLGFSVGGVIADLRDTELVLHDAATYPVLIALVCVLTRGPSQPVRLERLVRGAVLLSAPLALLQLAGAVGLAAIPNVDPWFWDRFRGWTDNPNQMALFSLLVCGLSAHLCVAAQSWTLRAGSVLAFSLALWSGILTKSNSFKLAVTVAAVLTLLLPAVRQMARVMIRPHINASGPRRGRAFASIVLVGLPMLAVSTIPLAVSLPSLTSVLVALSRDGTDGTSDEAKLRVEVWHSAFSRSMETGLIGLGPGPHLPIPAVLVNARLSNLSGPYLVRSPTIGETPNFESHNSFLEALLQGGILAAVSVAAIAAMALIRSLRAGHLVLFSFTLGILLFSWFHVITRHPGVWFILTLGLSSTGAAADRPRQVALSRSIGGPEASVRFPAASSWDVIDRPVG